MLKLILTGLLLSMPLFAGKVDGKYAKIRAYEKGEQIRFESRVPNIAFQVKKSDILKAMLKTGSSKSIADLEINGLIKDVDKKVIVTLRRVNDGLYIKYNDRTMFVSEKELDDIRK